MSTGAHSIKTVWCLWSFFLEQLHLGLKIIKPNSICCSLYHSYSSICLHRRNGLISFHLKNILATTNGNLMRRNLFSYCYFRPTFRIVLCAVAFCGGQMLIVLLNVILEGSCLRSRQAFRFPTPVWASITWFNGKLNTWLAVVTIQTSAELSLQSVLMDQGISFSKVLWKRGPW